VEIIHLPCSRACRLANIPQLTNPNAGGHLTPTSYVSLNRLTDWSSQFPVYNFSARTTQTTPFLIVVVISLLFEQVCLHSRYSATVPIYFLISRSLPSNGSPCYSMVMSPVGLGTKKHCAGERQQQFSTQLVHCIYYEGESSSVSEVDNFVIVWNLFDPAFNIRPILKGRWEITTYLPRSFFCKVACTRYIEYCTLVGTVGGFLKRFKVKRTLDRIRSILDYEQRNEAEQVIYHLRSGFCY
jgi:hypothetical protein